MAPTDSREPAGGATETCIEPRGLSRLSVRRFGLTVVEGPAVGVTWQSTTDRCSIGSHSSNHCIVDDPTVSRFHCEIVVDDTGARVRDLNSRNGTVLDGVSVLEAYLRAGSLLRVGKTVLRFELGLEVNRLPLADEPRFGSLTGASPPMRATFAMLARAAESSATVLLEGETGTGKSQAARSIHRKSGRADGPFVVVDCGAIHGNLLESELFGHEKGAFTGASERRLGAFEEAAGGTLFLDEVGELPLDLQPKLLRALEAREVKRVGANTHRPVDVRLVAATNRDLRTEVNLGRFRADLYFRLAVVTIRMPPLRQRPEDIPALVDEILASLHASPEQVEQLRAPAFQAGLRHAVWAGNVRELRNYLERCIVLGPGEPEPGGGEAAGEGFLVDPTAPYAAERVRALADFERRYFEALLRLHDGKVARAADAAGIDRTYLYRLLRRHRGEP
ncbi:sigma 54-interacting transcriptional regulator [Nannocystis radixulma]|uniref:Sigma 54-interacting transcriptional regulator n=1 Tax=Nannocystis radixulma TaxID=2995305 RepID=A0ABT5BE62_9BACT|nr:sigma 54-interacting transcriptional regulator [Nannocystis radixulma]MDC0672433.1 sigma 54-interacting transcriptional regulator [Nannocystis radixulma]